MVLLAERGMRDRFTGVGMYLIGVPISSNEASDDSLPNERKSKVDRVAFTYNPVIIFLNR